MDAFRDDEESATAVNGVKTVDENHTKRCRENVSWHESLKNSVAEITAELATLKSEKAALVGIVTSLKRSVKCLENAVETLTTDEQDVVVSEVHDRVRRSFNVLLFRMPESGVETPNGLREAVVQLLTYLGLTFPADNPLAIKRLGVYRGEFRPILVIFKSPTHAQVIVKNKSRLKAVPHWRNVLVGRDMTVNQRNAMRLRNET